MKIDFIVEEEDIVKEVRLAISPVEYLAISAALKQFSETASNHSSDIEVAKGLREAIENHGNDD